MSCITFELIDTLTDEEYRREAIRCLLDAIDKYGLDVQVTSVVYSRDTTIYRLCYPA